jgi:hypothetical protein
MLRVGARFLILGGLIMAGNRFYRALDHHVAALLVMILEVPGIYTEGGLPSLRPAVDDGYECGIYFQALF